MCFIMWGSRGVTTTPDRGVFICPQCSEMRQYKYKRVRRFGTLYMVPLLPMGDAFEYVECSVCKVQFKSEALGRLSATSDKGIGGARTNEEAAERDRFFNQFRKD